MLLFPIIRLYTDLHPFSPTNRKSWWIGWPFALQLKQHHSSKIMGATELTGRKNLGSSTVLPQARAVQILTPTLNFVGTSQVSYITLVQQPPLAYCMSSIPSFCDITLNLVLKPNSAGPWLFSFCYCRFRTAFQQTISTLKVFQEYAFLLHWAPRFFLPVLLSPYWSF